MDDADPERPASMVVLTVWDETNAGETMNVATIDLDIDDAKAQYAAYRSACKAKIARQAPEIQKRLREEHKAAQKILWHACRGRRVLMLSESMRVGGIDEKGWPRLAIARADHPFVWCESHGTGSITMKPTRGYSGRPKQSENFRFEIPGAKVEWHRAGGGYIRAVVPTIPPHLLPAGRLDRYHILWEAEWTPVAPKDPILLSRIDGDAFAVLAQWDLTPVERLVLQRRFDQ